MTAPLELMKKQPWQVALSNLVTDPEELLAILSLSRDLLPAARAAAQLFPLKVPRGFVERMQKGNVNDPLLKQVLPMGIETELSPDYSNDPLHESGVNPLPGLLHKYQSRVLITLTSACAIHCRYCFRRHFPYGENNPGRKGIEKIADYIRADESINEVILSGGDPLSVSDTMLQFVSEVLQPIPHIRRLRIHTRLPIVLPERVTDSLLAWLQTIKLKVVMVIHANHPAEINDEIRDVLAKLKHAGVTLLNQTVLLRGINDDAAILSELSETLFATGVLPYYLHVLDKVQGAAHFDLPRETSLSLHAALQKRLPGYLVPRLTVEEPGAFSKTLLSTSLSTC